MIVYIYIYMYTHIYLRHDHLARLEAPLLQPAHHAVDLALAQVLEEEDILHMGI